MAGTPINWWQSEATYGGYKLEKPFLIFNMAQPLVSAIIPSYNRPLRTQRAIDSVSNQSYPNIELIVVDDGSTPPLEEHVSIDRGEFEAVKFKKHEVNQGGNVARNTGIEVASGKYLAFLDSDDEWLVDKVREQVTHLEHKKTCSASYTSVKQLDDSGNLNAINYATKDGNILNNLLRGNVIGTFSSVMVSSEAIDQVGQPNPDLPCWQDWEWYLRLAKKVEFTAVENPVTVRYNEGDQISGSYRPKRDEAYPAIRQRIEELSSSAKQRRTGIAYLNFELGYSALVTGHYAEARRNFAKAIAGHPSDLTFYLYLACSGGHYPMIKSLKRTAVRYLGGG